MAKGMQGKLALVTFGALGSDHRYQSEGSLLSIVLQRERLRRCRALRHMMRAKRGCSDSRKQQPWSVQPPASGSMSYVPVQPLGRL